MKERGKDKSLFRMNYGKRDLVLRGNEPLRPGFACVEVECPAWAACIPPSFISGKASKGFINSIVGHSSEEQRRRNSHMYFELQQEATRELSG
jgi:hypothetical protein